MSKYTKANLEALNKGQVVDVALQLAAQVDAASGKPLTSAEIEKTLLELNSQAISVKSASEKAKREHDEAVATIHANTEKAIKELELKYESGKSTTADELNKTFDEIKVKAQEAIDNLSYGLKEAEIEAKGKLESIKAEVVEAQAKFDETIAKFNEEVATAKAEKASQINTINVEHTRTVEQLRYDNQIAIRDENEAVAAKIAKSVGKELVSSAELEELKNTESATKEEIEEDIASAVATAESKVYAKEGAKYNKLESDTRSEIALLKNDKGHLTTTVEKQAERIEDLEQRLKDVPAQIAAAVSAAKAPISVTQATGK